MNTEVEKVAERKIRWKADPEHSEITFTVKPMMITTVTGIISEYQLDVFSDGEQFLNVKVEFRGKAASITTGNDKRDNHLRSAEFFDVEKYPEIIFQCNECASLSKNLLKGNLSIINTTRPVILNVELLGINQDPWGNTRAGFHVTGILKRKNFGLNWNAPLQPGGVLVSEDVKINCKIQMVKQKA